jgi:hypothetical protein
MQTRRIGKNKLFLFLIAFSLSAFSNSTQTDIFVITLLFLTHVRHRIQFKYLFVKILQNSMSSIVYWSENVNDFGK